MDRRAALTAWVLAMVNRDAEKQREPYTLEQVVSWLGHGFMQETPDEEPAPPTVDELKNRIEMLHGFYSANGQGEGV
jgi:hypothetical protein